jgi:LysM repeat protein
MRPSKRLVRVYLPVIIIMIHISACAGISNAGATLPATNVPVIPIDKPGVVNADTTPVRTGPSVEFEQIANISHGYTITVQGQSADGKWYKVEIPGYGGDQSSLWIAVDFVTIVDPTATLTETAVVFVPSSTPTETTTAQTLAPSQATTLTAITQSLPPACQAPAGWVLYTVQRGDTLFRLAAQTNTSVDQIMRANCLSSDRIAAGSPLYLPFIPPTDTLLPPVTPTSTTTFSPVQTLTNTPTATIPFGTPTPTDTQRPIDTVTPSKTAIVSPAAPTPVTAIP